MANQMELISMQNCSKGALVAIAAVLTLAGCGAAADTATDYAPDRGPDFRDPTVLDDAVSNYGLDDNRWVSIGDEGETLVIDGADDLGYSGLKIAKIACLAIELDLSDATIARIDSTNSLMGQQEATDGDLELLWSYHPDNGLDLVVTTGSAS